MITLVTDDAVSTRYLEEIVRHAGLSCRWKDASSLDRSDRIIVLAGNRTYGTEIRQRIEELVTAGVALVVTGGTVGLDNLLGAREVGSPDEGYLVGMDAQHPVSAGLHPPLHVFGAAALRATSGTTLARLTDTSAIQETGDAIVVSRAGRGATVVIGANIPFSVFHIQTGTPVYEDGAPAPDGTAAIDDGILKAEDGMVLSWEHDRIQTATDLVPDCTGIDPAYPNGDTPWFAVPIADELRLLLLQAIAWAASESGQALAALHEWPNGLDAVAMISHDSDLNLDASAHTTLRLLDEAGIKSTWCHMWGPTYSTVYEPGTFPKIREAGHEFALHYNAFDKDGGTWGREHLAWQADFVRKEAGVDGFVSNKNHYTRWEGQVDFFSWMIDEGIQIDQSRGPSKKGTVGYPLGSSLPVLPLDPETGQFIDVLELPMQFQDLSLTTPPYMAETTWEQARRHHGVAHYLFHQIHLHTKPDVAEAFLQLANDVHDAGLEWTCERIIGWERARREVQVTLDGDRVCIDSCSAIAGATIAVTLPQGTAPDNTRVIHGASSLDTHCGERWNQRVLTFQLDLKAGETVLTLEQAG
jgi:hypothetical protein